MPATRRRSTDRQWRCKAILRKADDPRRFFAAEAQTAATVEECLRFDAPLHMFTRYALSSRDRGRGRHVVKLGDTIGLLLGAANRDPARFADADSFDPFRSRPAANVSFGAGIHFCIGAPLARIELQVALKVLFERLPGLRLAAEPQLPRHLPFPRIGEAGRPVLKARRCRQSLITYSLRVVSSTSQLPLKPGLSTKASPARTVRASPPSSGDHRDARQDVAELPFVIFDAPFARRRFPDAGIEAAFGLLGIPGAEFRIA